MKKKVRREKDLASRSHLTARYRRTLFYVLPPKLGYEMPAREIPLMPIVTFRNSYNQRICKMTDNVSDYGTSAATIGNYEIHPFLRRKVSRFKKDFEERRSQDGTHKFEFCAFN